MASVSKFKNKHTFQKWTLWVSLAGDTYLYVSTHVLFFFFFFLILLFYLRKTKFELCCYKSQEATRKKHRVKIAV